MDDCIEVNDIEAMLTAFNEERNIFLFSFCVYSYFLLNCFFLVFAMLNDFLLNQMLYYFFLMQIY